MKLKYKLILGIVFAVFLVKNIYATDVYTTIVPMQSLVSMVTKGTNSPLLITQNSSLHHNELSYKQIKMLKTAKVIVILNKDFEYDIYKQINPKNTIIIEATNAPNLKLLNIEGTKYIDYHIWHDVSSFIIMLNYVAEELSKIYPDNSLIYKKNAKEYSDLLNDIDSKNKESFKNFNKKIMFFHNAWQYYSLHYKINVFGNIITESGFHSHGFAVSNKQILDLLNTSKQNNISCIFIEPEYNFKDLNKILNENGIKTPLLEPMESYSGNDYVSFYIDSLKQNTQTIIGC